MIFGKKLRKLAAPKEYPNQDAFAEAVGVSKSTLGRWLSGTAWPDINQLKTLAQIFDVPVGYLADDSLDEPSDQGELTEDEILIVESWREEREKGVSVTEAIKRLGRREEGMTPPRPPS
jgi:transcriptional regulator with XRE-family HTH domain